MDGSGLPRTASAVSRLPDPWVDGLSGGWRVLGVDKPPPDKLTCDVVVVGTGAGGGITAELLARAGFDVLMVEEGPLKTSKDFNQLESEAYPRCTRKAPLENRRQGHQHLAGTLCRWLHHGQLDQFLSHAADTLAFWRERLGLSELTDDVLSPTSCRRSAGWA